MTFPIETENVNRSICFQCTCPINKDPIVFSYDAMDREPGRVNQNRVNKDPEFMPSPASTWKMSQARIRLRLLDQPAGGHRGRYLNVLVGHSGDIYFCSTACLRQFFNSVVDAFEASPRK